MASCSAPVMWAAGVCSWPWREKISYLSRKVRKKIRRTLSGVALPTAVKAVRQGCADAERQYEPQVFEGKISLFLPSRKSLRNSPAEDGGWGKYASDGVVAYEVPGDHGSIVDEPSAGELATLILSGIERARVEHGRRIRRPQEVAR